MKKILAIIILFPVMVFGQQTTQNNDNGFPIIKHEFGLNMYSMTDMQIYRNMRALKQYQDYIVTNSFFTGVYYKYYFGKNGLRSSFDYFHNVINDENQWEYLSWKRVIEIKSGEIKLGYERLFAVKKYIPYVFSDILYSYGRTNYSDITYNEQTGVLDYWNGKIANHEFGLAFGVGFKYRPIKNLSIGVETSFQTVYKNVWRPEDMDHFHDNIFFFWNPVRILSIGLTL